MSKDTASLKAERPLAVLVDDDPAMLEILRLIFEDAGWSVAEAGDARGALDAIRCLNPQLVTLDLMMPINEAFTSTDLVRVIDNDLPHILLIIVSAFSCQPPIKTYFHDRQVPVLSKANLDKARLKKLLLDIRRELERAKARPDSLSPRSS